MSVHIIAEAGSNYNGSVTLAKQLSGVAKAAGADSVKFQIIYTNGLYKAGQYAFGHYEIDDVRRVRDLGELPDEAWQEIAQDAATQGIPFSASVFDTRGLDLLCKLDPPYIKLASCDLNNLRFLREVAARGRRMIVSTGMSTLADIEKTVSTLNKEGICGDKLVLLHCVSAYPAKLEDTNLGFLQTLRSAFGTAVGFSDHTLSSEAAAVAIALGATWIEKHFTTDHTLEGFDHKHAMEPQAFQSYVETLRAAETALLPKVIKIGPAEAYTRERARRGVYFSKDLPAGHRLTEQDIEVLRPQSPIAADEADDVVGMILKHSVDAHSAVRWSDLES
ncbi:MAG: N-acetylneuraminate synthase family protein [Verrucomicrobiales bacterium]|nr:N-acetylneuraminate synthase family protein [Verrucomicrobiales bacterium]MCP5556551.1 N-acetylneuraminate synthase family protein [Verrucomicrobiaceae bacterium]